MSTSFGPILLKFYRCLNHGVKFCMCFLWNPIITFFFFFFFFPTFFFTFLTSNSMKVYRE